MLARPGCAGCSYSFIQRLDERRSDPNMRPAGSVSTYDAEPPAFAGACIYSKSMSTQVRSSQATPNSSAVQGSGTAECAVAESAQKAWERAFTVLSPVIGYQGVAGLYRRALSLSRREHLSLVPLYEATRLGGIELTKLQAMLLALDSVEAAAVQASLGRHFVELLSQLIGARLAEHLLHPTDELIHPLNFNGSAAKDPSS